MTGFTESIWTALQLVTSGDAVLWSVVRRSLAVSATACVLACGLGLWLGAWLAVSRFKGRGLVLAGLNTLLALPSVVVGLVVYLLLSRSGPLGFLGWMFSFQAMVVAQTVLVVPVVTALTRQAIEDADLAHGEQWQSLGASRWQRAALLLWDERFALLTVGITAFGRAVSEVGAVMIVGGNIDGFTRVMTTAIALETSKGDLPLALGLGLVLLGVVAVLNVLLLAVRLWRKRTEGQRGGARLPDASGAVSATVSASGRVPGAVADAAATTDAAAGTELLPPLSPSALGPAVLGLTQAHLRLGGVDVLNGIDLHIHAGERVALVGANGSGKSTLLRLLHGLVQPTAGHRWMQAGQRQAMLFQRPHMLRTTALHNAALALWTQAGWLRPGAWAHSRARATQALAQVGLLAQTQRPAKTLSGGQQQRLALARACACQPDLLLLDEPTASLDPHAKRDVETLIAALGQHKTLVFASHNLGQVKRLATRVLYLEQGRVLADLSVQDFFSGDVLPRHHPEAHLFVQGEIA